MGEKTEFVNLRGFSVH